jgi:hypothetical protein
MEKEKRKKNVERKEEAQPNNGPIMPLHLTYVDFPG